MPGQGIIHGLKRPIFHGAKHNGAPFGNSIPGVTRDASGKYVPANATEWTALMAAAGLGTGNPASTWFFQMASGNAVDTIGALTLPASGTGLAYQQAVAGWSHQGVTMTDGGTGKFVAGAAVGPDPSTTSTLWMGYVDFLGIPAGVRNIVSAGGSTSSFEACAKLTTVPVIQAKCLTVQTAGTTNPVTPGVIPVIIKYDRTHSAIVAYTDADKIVGTYSATVTDGGKGFGATQATDCNMALVYGCMFSGAPAEITDAQVKTLLQTLGWNILWT